MREIKFRGKIIDNGKWVYGFYYMGGWDFVEKNCDRHIIFDLKREYMVDKETVGQYTGFKDVAGKAIYEGDILKWQSIDTDGSLLKQEDEVFYKNGMFVVSNTDESLCEYLEHDYDKIEIIGNIHESGDENE